MTVQLVWAKFKVLVYCTSKLVSWVKQFHEPQVLRQCLGIGNRWLILPFCLFMFLALAINNDSASANLPTKASIPSPQSFRAEGPDTDEFRTFDALPQKEQVKLLEKYGPRLPQEYKTNDLSWRALVRGGWPFALDYELISDRPAEFTVRVEGADTFRVEIQSPERKQIQPKFAEWLGSEPRVAKLRIAALTKDNKPADFRLHGIGVGKKGIESVAEGKVNSSPLVANLRPDPVQKLSYGPASSLVLTGPQIGSSVMITAEPAAISVNAKQAFTFELKPKSDFSNGNWIVWLVKGLNWQEVYSKPTGRIVSGRSTPGGWNGVGRDGISKGTHALQLTAWHAEADDRSWVIARTEPRLVVNP